MFKTIAFWILGLGLIALAFVGLKPEPKPQTTALLPWDITINANGNSSVFGITLGESSVQEVLSTLGEDHDLAIMSDDQDNAGLEIYYSHFKAGPLGAKLIINVAIDPETMLAMQEQAETAEYLHSGARKFMLNARDLAAVQSLAVDSLTLIPAANLKEDIITSRFGAATEVIQLGENTQHFIYPELGLDIALNEEGKESFQYVSPKQFDRLLTPLLKAVELQQDIEREQQ